jgi:Fe-S oxidoreductase/uncharacterized protein (DUF952 family)
MQKAAGLILKHKGSLSGEHGDGLIRSWLNETLFGSRVMEAFLLLKQAFDPLNLMNPGKVVNGVPFDALQEDLRLNPKTALNTIPTYLSFEKEGGFALTADLCNGNGECRKQTGIMCPSFQATLDEFNTTRARANVLQSMIHKTKGAINWNDPSVRKVLDLCLECKGCKTECPSAVDMTKLKMEFLYHYNKWNGISLRTRLLSSFSKWIHIGALMPRFTTWLISRDWVKEIQKWLRIAPERSLPTPAPERFSVWFSRNVQGKQVKGKQVVLYNDTYTEFLYPEVGISAVKILHLLGYEVILPPWRCCGRPLLSKGRLKKGQKMATKVIRTLTPYLKAKIPVLGLEPSCLFTLLDEYQDLPDLDAKALKSVAKTFDRFVADHLEEGKLPLPFKESACKIKVHGHCHEKAIEGIESTLAVLRAIPGVEVEAIPSGCCGMAGSFGYEQEHYDLSMKIGELVLLPEVRRASKETLIVANGFSCRTQIADGAGRSAIHLAEALNRFLTILLLATTFGIASLQGQESKPVIQEVPTNEKIAMPQYLYKIVSREEWQASQEHKVVEKSPLDTAFIHLATEEQIVHVTEKFWKDKAYFILKLDPSKLKGRLVLETNPGGTTRYYHLYEGSIPLDAVVEVLTP